MVLTKAQKDLIDDAIDKVGPPGRGSKRLQDILTLRDAGFTNKQIGEYFGVSTDAIRMRLKRAGE